MLTSSRRIEKTRKISPKLSATFAIGTDIAQTSIPKIQKKSRKTGVSLGDYYANDSN